MIHKKNNLCARCFIEPGTRQCSQCGLVSYCSAECQELDWALHHPNCRNTAAIAVAAARRAEPLSVLGSLSVSARLEPVQPIVLSLPSLEARQGGALVGVLASPASLRDLDPALVAGVTLVPNGSRQAPDAVPVEIVIELKEASAVMGSVMDIVFNSAKFDPSALIENDMRLRPQVVARLRASVLHDVVVPVSPLPLPPAADSGFSFPANVVLPLLMGRLALRDVCCLARVCKEWRVAVDGAASFWKRLIYWEPLTLLVALEADEDPRFGTDLGRWMGLLQRVRAMSLRQQVQTMLNVPASCQACGVALQGRHLTKALKTGAVVREIPVLSNLTRLCGDCGNDFVVPQQSARSLFPEIGRADYLLLRSLKLDNRKCLILSDLRHRASRKRGELLEHEARTLGITARQLWERRNVPRAKNDHLSGTDAVKAFFDEIDDEEEDGVSRSRNGDAVAAAKSAEPKKVSWVPVHLVFEQPGEEWAPDSNETVARRNLELLQELRLVEMVKREDTQVGFVETLETPYSEATPAPAKKQRKRRDDDDEDDYEEEPSGSPEKRGRGRGKSSSQEFRAGDDDDDDGDDDDDIDSDEEDEDSFIKPAKKKGSAAANNANNNNSKKKGGRKKKKGAYDDDEDEMGEEGGDDDDDDGVSYGRKGRKKKGSVAASSSSSASRKGGRKGSARNGKAAAPSRDRPNVIKTFAELQSNPELKSFIAKFGWSKVPPSHPEYRVCVAKYDTSEKPEDGDGLLKFRMRDEMMVGFWNDKSGWSVCYLLNDARSDRGGYQWGLVANNYVEMIDYWTSQEMADAISHKLDQ